MHDYESDETVSRFGVKKKSRACGLEITLRQ